MKQDRQKFIRILSYFRPFLGRVILCAALALLVNAAELAAPYLMKVAIDDYIVAGKTNFNITGLALLYLGSVTAGSFCLYSHTYLLNSTVQRIMHNIRVELFAHIQRMPLRFFDTTSSGRILTRATNDVEALNEMYSGVLVAFFKDVLMLVGIVVVMLRLHLQLALVSFAVIPVIVLITFFYNKYARRNYRRVRHLIAQINGFFAENISGMKLVQIFHREREKYREFESLNRDYNQASIFEVRLMAFFKPSAELINNLGIALLIVYCTPGIFGGVLEIGLLYAFITYIKRFFEPIQDLADKYNVILSGSIAAERIFEIMDNREGLEDLGAGRPLPSVRGGIEFRHVWFSYNNRDWVLRDVSFTVEPGRTVAFVGATGSGKSTIISLIGRFYEIQRGEILLDGVNIREYRLGDLRHRIAVVMQDVFLFSGDIASNIRLNNADRSDAAVRAAAESVNAAEFIAGLPGGYAEEVKERGATLSSGQRQLLSFARAVVFDPAILVLDEATANIDTETEQVIQQSLAKVSRDRTTLVIAHRLSTIRNADQIIVIHKGRIRETGRHEELLRQGGIYKNLYEMQYCGMTS